jgi:hypothetical protein
MCVCAYFVLFVFLCDASCGYMFKLNLSMYLDF